MCVCSVCTAFVSYIIKKTIEYNIEQFVWFIDAFGFSYAKLRRITLQITYNVLMLCDAWWKFMMRFLISQMNLLALELFRERATSNKFQQHISLSVRIVWMCECLCELRIRLVSLVLRLVLVFFVFVSYFSLYFYRLHPYTHSERWITETTVLCSSYMKPYYHLAFAYYSHTTSRYKYRDKVSQDNSTRKALNFI